MGQTIRGVGLILADRRLYGLAAVAAVSVGSFLTTRALWTGPYLNDVFGLDLIPRGNVIFALSLAWLVSALGRSPVEAYQAMFGALAIALLVAVLIYRRTEDVPPSKDVGR